MKIKTTIRKWGNSLGLRITGPMKSIPKFEENMPVTVDISENGILIEPIKKSRLKLPFTEAELLGDLDKQTSREDKDLIAPPLPKEYDA